MADQLETLRDILAETLGVKVPITDAEAVAAKLRDAGYMLSARAQVTFERID